MEAGSSKPKVDVDSVSAKGRKGSVVAERYASGRWKKEDEKDVANVPTNEEVAKAVYDKVLEAVEISNRYYHVIGYSLFVAAYLIVLYIQAWAFKSADVVTTLRNALMPGDQLNVRFKNEDEVLGYIGTKAVLPIWKDPVCGDSKCEWPWEFPAFGRFGCRADCGLETNTTKVMVQVKANFAGHPTLSPRILMANARWNLCLKDEARRKRGEEDLCWFEEDEKFNEIIVNRLETMQVIDGTWYIKVTGDYAGRLSGRIFDVTNQTNPEEITLEPKWTECKIPKSSRTYSVAGTQAVRRLLTAYSRAQAEGGTLDNEYIKNVIEEAREEEEAYTRRKLQEAQERMKTPSPPPA